MKARPQCVSRLLLLCNLSCSLLFLVWLLLVADTRIGYSVVTASQLVLQLMVLLYTSLTLVSSPVGLVKAWGFAFEACKALPSV
jgi:uncharacterized protein (DUF486 family)